MLKVTIKCLILITLIQVLYYKQVKSTASGIIGKSQFRIIVTGDYTGKENFLKPKSLKEK
ncbi:hypothetical protein DRF59_00040 [Chryseobacterium flavum]|uniref:Uncharacterized protein n=1 Tax=Chryseobacterium flavum TaxID=415851 RepID=A0A3D9CU41_9FLAO|nr:hypothetical protein DRF59_00040 [Chryseobacterium flavum]